jgi:hypothetical protein
VTHAKAKEMMVVRAYSVEGLIDGQLPDDVFLRHVMLHAISVCANRLSEPERQRGPFAGAQARTLLNCAPCYRAHDLIQTLKRHPDPDLSTANGSLASITFHEPSMSLIIRASQETHFKLDKRR